MNYFLFGGLLLFMTTFSHGGELFSTCDVCNGKFVQKYFKPIRAGHLTVCNNPKCIVEAMHNTWIPRISIDDVQIISTISEVCNVPQHTVSYHINIAKAVYQVMISPILINLETAYLLEAILFNTFCIDVDDTAKMFEYVKTIDVMLKPYWIPFGRKAIDTNYPLSSVVMASYYSQQHTPGMLEDIRCRYKPNMHVDNTYAYDSYLDRIDILSGFTVPGCVEIPVSRKSIILGQVFMYRLGGDNMFCNNEIFSKVVRTGCYASNCSPAKLKKMQSKITKVIASHMSHEGIVSEIATILDDTKDLF